MSLLRAEYRKVTGRKLVPLMIGLLAFLMAFIAVLFYILIPALPESADVGLVPQKPEAFSFGAVQVAGQAWWFAVIVATTVLGGEMAGSVWATSLTRDSRKAAHLIARFIVFTLASWLAFLVGTAVWAAITSFAADGQGAPEVGEWLGLLWKFAAVSAAWTSIGLGAVAMTRSVAVAMGVALGVSFVDSIVAPFVGLYETISLTAASNGIFDVAGDGPFAGFVPGGDMGTAHALAIMAGWSAVGLALTWWGLQRRDA